MASKGSKNKFTEAQDDAFDKKNGIRENSKKDKALDKKRGLPPEKPVGKKKKK